MAKLPRRRAQRPRTSARQLEVNASGILPSVDRDPASAAVVAWSSTSSAYSAALIRATRRRCASGHPCVVARASCNAAQTAESGALRSRSVRSVIAQARLILVIARAHGSSLEP